MTRGLQCSGLLWAAILPLIVATACGPVEGSAESSPTPQAPAPTITPLAVAQASPTPAQATPAALTLSIWWPEPLAPAGRPAVTALLSEQLAGFAESEPEPIEIAFRVKLAGTETGAILPTLQTAGAVAPAALPHLTLIRRDQLVAAVNAGLIQPLEGLVATSVISGLYDGALALGQVDGLLYGLPYMLDALVMAYTGAEPPYDGPGISFEALLDAGLPLVFPGGRTNGLNNTVLVQYQQAGGSLTSSDTSPVVDAEALRTVLTFYAEARDAGLIDAEALLNATNSSGYEAGLLDGTLRAAVISSEQAQRLRMENDLSLHIASLPTADGAPATQVNGWLWVMTATTPSQQALAARFLDWMMQVERQRTYAEAIYLLPSQDIAVRTMDRRLVDAATMDALLDNAFIAGAEGSTGTLARAIQNAFINVINGDRSVEQAVADVVGLAD